MRTPVQQHEVERRIKTNAENALGEARDRVQEWITEGGDKGATSIRGAVRGLEAWHTAMVIAGEGVKYRFMPGILQELMASLEMTPAEGKIESEQGTRQSVGTQTQSEADTEMTSVGTQVGAAAAEALSAAIPTEMESSVSTATQTEMENSVAAATQTEMENSVAATTWTDLPQRDIQTEQSRAGTPESG